MFGAAGSVIATYLGPITTGGELLASANNGGITSGQARQYTVHTVRGGGTGIVLTCTGVEWDTMQGEILLPSYDMKAAVEYPLGSGTFTSVVSETIGASDRYKDVTVDTRAFADGAQFGLWVWASGTRIPSIGTSGANNTQLYTDEACEVGASVSQTPTNAPSDSLTRRRRMCVVAAISGQISGTSVACIGDSIMAYQTSTLAANSATADHVRGDVVRSLSQYYPCYNLGLGADQPSSALYSDRTLQRMLARRCTHMFDGYGVNEVENRALTGDYAWAFHLRMAASFAGLKYVHSTLVPRTTGSWADEASQTADATKTPRLNAYNTLALAQVDQTWNRRALVQGADTDKWAGGAALDGLHPTLAGQDRIIADKVTGKAKIDAAAVPAQATQPGLTLALTSTPTFSGGRFTRGTATLDGAAASALPSSTEFYANAIGNSAFDVLCGTAGRLYVSSGGVLTYTRQATGTTTTSATPVVGTGEHHWRIVTLPTGTRVYMDGVEVLSSATVPNATQTNTRIVATVSNGNGTLRDLTTWAADRTGAAIPPAGAIPSSNTGLVAYWPLASDGTGQFGPWLGAL